MKEMSNFEIWFRNALTFHHRVMMRYLKKRGWVVFYLEPEHRTCENEGCWINLYQSAEQAEDYGPETELATDLKKLGWII